MCPERRMCASLAHPAIVKVRKGEGEGEGGRTNYDYSEDMKFSGEINITFYCKQNCKRTIQMKYVQVMLKLINKKGK